MAAYTGSGSITLKGCAAASATKTYVTKFEPRDAAYIRQRAIKGIIEKVVVKEVLIYRGRKSYNQAVWVYKDTLNGLHNESDLLTYQEAVAASAAYVADMQAQAQAYKC